MIKKIFKSIFVLGAICSAASSFAQNQLAFPTAEGYGKYTVGGRGGKVYEVTNLDASGEGSFRAAVEAKGPRTVVFRVSGTIEGNFNIREGNITIAGQTAPGDGICVKGSVNISADDVIIRYIRVRPDPTKSETDAIGGKGRKNIIFDHISASFSSDEIMSLYFNENVTIQWCMITEACEKKGQGHRFGGIWGNNYGTYHHNLIANNDNRNPRWASGSKYNDYRNNVIYNWGYGSSNGGEKQQPGNPQQNFTTINMVANYCKPGPGTGNAVRTSIADPKSRKPEDKGSWYIAENVVVGSPEVTADNWKGVVGSAFIKLDKPWDAMPIKQQSPEAAYESVLAQAGCSLPARDAMDKRIIEEVRNGTANHGKNGIITTPSDVGGWPELKSAPAPADTDHDGMPDEWETKQGLDPKNPDDRNKVAADGYTMLEKYLNSLE